jgi:hypothetical protein
MRNALGWDDTKQTTLTRLAICRNEKQWSEICDAVKRADPTGMGQYPDWWEAEVIQSGLGDKKVAEFKRSAEERGLTVGWGTSPEFGWPPPIPEKPERPKVPEGTRDIDWDD